MEHRAERVIIETDRYRVVGCLTLPRDGYRSRMSDFLNAADRDFISLTDVTIAPLSGDAQPESRGFVAVSRRHVVLAMPEADGADEPPN